MGPIVCPETLANADPRCVTCQKNEITYLRRSGSLKLRTKPNVMYTGMRRITTDRIHDGGPIGVLYTMSGLEVYKNTCLCLST